MYLIRIAKIQNTDDAHKFWGGCGATGTLFLCRWKCKMVWPVFQGEGRRGGIQKIFRAMKILSLILSWWIHDMMHLQKPMECTTQRVRPHAGQLWILVNNVLVLAHQL